jgi:hypothetical protein
MDLSSSPGKPGGLLGAFGRFRSLGDMLRDGRALAGDLRRFPERPRGSREPRDANYPPEIWEDILATQSALVRDLSARAHLEILPQKICRPKHFPGLARAAYPPEIRSASQGTHPPVQRASSASR